MKNGIVSVFLSLSVLLGSGVGAAGKDRALNTECSEEERKIAKIIDRDADALYRVGKQIKKFVREKDIDGLFSLIDGELFHGPRRSYAKAQGFDYVFSAVWRQDILNDKIPCSPINFYSNVFLGVGDGRHGVLYSEHGIVAIYGARKEDAPSPAPPLGWETRRGLIPPRCFFSDYERMSIAKSIDLARCLAKPARDALGPPKIEWPAASESGAAIDFLKEKKWVISGYELSGGYFSGELAYRILRRVSADTCKDMAPHLPGKCLESYLMSVGYQSKGAIWKWTEGWVLDYVIFGLFLDKNGQENIVPLKDFLTQNDARNFLDSIKK